MRFYLIKISAENPRGRMETVIQQSLIRAEELSCHIVKLQTAEQFRRASEAGLLKGEKLLFAVELDESGVNLEAYRLLKYINSCGNALDGSVGGIIIDGYGELYTKDLGRRLAFAANMAGCSFPGKPLVEATGSLSNLDVIAKNWNTDRQGAYVKSCISLVERMVNFSADGEKTKGKPYVLAVHASSRKTSNSLRLWEEVASNMEGLIHIEEISIQNGQIWDCRGCKYEECLHFGENSNCFYGGVMVEKVYPAILKCDILVLICPNYNDAVSANIMAFINRLTAVFRTNDFSRKRIYAIVVSGYSGGDIVAQQIMGAMNMNKNFILPGRFALIETANDPYAIMKLDGIKNRAAEFAENILSG